MEHITKAIIIAAGQGTRLRPVTDEMPKPLVPVNGVRLIDTTIRALRENGIKDIYIVVGYKKEQFYEVYGAEPDIHLIENPRYAEGNNILSAYYAREFLPDSFVIEGDIIVQNNAVYVPEIERSFYCCEWLPHVPEWAVQDVDGRLVFGDIKGGLDNAYRMWGISAWNHDDGLKLAEMIREEVETKKNLSLYWDEVALREHPEEFDLALRKIRSGDLTEIDTVKELAEADASYQKYIK